MWRDRQKELEEESHWYYEQFLEDLVEKEEHNLECWSSHLCCDVAKLFCRQDMNHFDSSNFCKLLHMFEVNGKMFGS